MDDSTPEVKTFTSKYLTPCRTFGLKRKSTPKSDFEKKVKSENDSSVLKAKAMDESPVSRKLNKSRSCSTRLKHINRKLENQSTSVKDGNTSPKYMESIQSEGQVKPLSSSSILNSRLKTDPTEYHVTPIKSNNLSSSSELGRNKSLDVQLVMQIKRINEKFGRLEKLKQEQIYSRKHNMLELQKTTEKWMSGFKEVAVALHCELEARGRSCTLLDLLEEHNIPPERVDFNTETLEFD